MGNARYRRGFAITLHADQITLPLRWKRAKRVFVNSMSDLFHEAVPDDYIRQVFDVMVEARWHAFQILTKRSRRLAALAPRLPWPPNVWQGVSVENASYTSRVTDLQSVPASVRFLSVEPLLGPIPALPLDGIHWVIVGGESGVEGVGQWPLNGPEKSAINASLPASHSFSSSGVGEPRRRVGASSTAGSGMKGRHSVLNGMR
jgi:protein gp37